ncbi:FlgD immunoglobulin-like domain containing protein [Candidatus Eisenbacteria bacterium]|uniref:FlgD immunoglobulin-like domain containing protein n=1 Tax=Eiseniibacteriota bacterium TaxID=2212470 RepID=A0ABV6YKZ4_UNCEI
MRTLLVGLVLLGATVVPVCADPHNLEGGALITHYVPSDFDRCPDDICDCYWWYHRITDCDEQETSVVTSGWMRVYWFVLAAFEEDKEWSQVQFGLGDYDPTIMSFSNFWTGPCYRPGDSGFVIESPGWPGPGEGITIVATSAPWTGNWEPVYSFAAWAYGYYGASGVVQLVPDPTAATPFGGFRNCADPPEQWDAALGGMGVNHPGTWTCGNWYESVCCIDDDCIISREDECTAQGGEYHVGWLSCDPNPCINACCIVDSCQILNEGACAHVGGEWHVGSKTCDPNPCTNACCIGAECMVLDEEGCLTSGGEWQLDVKACDPMPCATACCDLEDCQIMNVVLCAESGGLWLAGVHSCDPNPCIRSACCLGDVCQILPEVHCAVIGGEWREGIDDCTPNPCGAADLSGGILIAHAPPTLHWSSGTDYCQRYLEEFAISNSHEQIPQVAQDTLGDGGTVWYVISAWAGPKECCAVEFGFGEYDPDIFWFQGSGPCNHGDLEVPSNEWPGPHEGTLVVNGGHWSGNYVPIYWFGGYALEEGLIPLGINEADGFGGFTNCDASGVRYDAACFGALGIGVTGAACYHSVDLQVCCMANDCYLVSQAECAVLGGSWHVEWGSCDPNPCAGSGVEPRDWEIGTRLLPPRPNPFTLTTVIRYCLEEPGRLQIDILDASGRRVRGLLSERKPAGSGSVSWDGRDRSGRRVAPGAYFFRLVTGDEVVSRRTVVLK